MVKELNTKAGKLLLVPLNEPFPIKRPDGILLGKFSELEDNIFEEFVVKMPFSFSDRFIDYSAYMYSPNYFKTAKESFISLCKSQGIEINDNYLIIKML